METLIFAHPSLRLSSIKTPHPRCVGVWQNDRVEIIANEQVSSIFQRLFGGGRMDERRKRRSERRLRERKPPLEAAAVLPLFLPRRWVLLPLALRPCKRRGGALLNALSVLEHAGERWRRRKGEQKARSGSASSFFRTCRGEESEKARPCIFFFLLLLACFFFFASSLFGPLPLYFLVAQKTHKIYELTRTPQNSLFQMKKKKKTRRETARRRRTSRSPTPSA